jgi:hypothetical protein
MPGPEQKWCGGARIGLMNATWPFAQLRLTSKQLVLQVLFLGTYCFEREQVTRIESCGLIPLVGKGVRIHHRVGAYPKKIVFWYFCVNPESITEKIRQYGYGT